MKNWMIHTPALVLILALASVGAAWAEEDEVDNGIGLEVVDDLEAGEEDFVEEIRLPEPAADQARESAEFGIETANEARERGREFGKERAQEARELGQEGRELGQEAREARGRPEGAGSGGTGRPEGSTGSD